MFKLKPSFKAARKQNLQGVVARNWWHRTWWAAHWSYRSPPTGYYCSTLAQEISLILWQDRTRWHELTPQFRAQWCVLEKNLLMLRVLLCIQCTLSIQLLIVLRQYDWGLRKLNSCTEAGPFQRPDMPLVTGCARDWNVTVYGSNIFTKDFSLLQQKCITKAAQKTKQANPEQASWLETGTVS